jgi:hypothetical protein
MKKPGVVSVTPGLSGLVEAGSLPVTYESDRDRRRVASQMNVHSDWDSSDPWDALSAGGMSTRLAVRPNRCRRTNRDPHSSRLPGDGLQQTFRMHGASSQHPHWAEFLVGSTDRINGGRFLADQMALRFGLAPLVRRQHRLPSTSQRRAPAQEGSSQFKRIARIFRGSRRPAAVGFCSPLPQAVGETSPCGVGVRPRLRCHLRNRNRPAYADGKSRFDDTSDSVHKFDGFG